jgi:GxxExxY protein
VPIECSIGLEKVDQERFHAVDKVVMRHAFDVHNTLGRFFDERIYQNELAERCRADGMDLHREVHVRVSHGSFVKPYYLDLLVQDGIVYELKAVEALTGNHERQLIHYLLLTGLSHGKLVNFRPESVEFRFVSTRLDHARRNRFNIIEATWEGDDTASSRLKSILGSLLEDWGAFLEVALYQDALIHLMAESVPGICPVDVEVNGRVVGTQKMCLLDSETAWHLSAIRRNLRSYETHIRRLIAHTSLTRVQWINLDHETITLNTLKK